MTEKSLVYSYVRFSTKEQRKGTGHQRQNALALQWCRQHGHELAHTYPDLGISAFKGRNASHGELALILKCIETGAMPSGSILLVESLDRISRNNINKALELFLSIINKGVTVVTLCDSMEYSAAKCDLPQLMMSLLIFARANDESKMKSQRKAASWQYKREAAVKDGTPIGGNTPKWIKVVNGRYEVIPAEAEKVKSIFSDYVRGHGLYLLNKKYGLAKATIGNWLNNPMVIGTLRMTAKGERIDLPDHYPAIIDLKTWKQAQVRKSERYINRKPGKVGYVNLFAGILVDHTGYRFETQRHYGFPSYVSPNGIVLQVRPLEIVVCYEKLGSKFVRVKHVETTSPSPEAEIIAKRIVQVQKELVEGTEMVVELVPVLRSLKIRQKELEKNQQRTVTEAIDYGLITSLLTDDGSQDARLQLREIVRENVKLVQIEHVTATNWYMLVRGRIDLVNGEMIRFSYAYCTRRIGYLMTDDNSILYRRTWEDGPSQPEVIVTKRNPPRSMVANTITDELKLELTKLPLRKPHRRVKRASRSGSTQ